MGFFYGPYLYQDLENLEINYFDLSILVVNHLF
jgi:hypothetical protein